MKGRIPILASMVAALAALCPAPLRAQEPPPATSQPEPQATSRIDAIEQAEQIKF